jgi:ribose/xylose/arabinose/galactoside ABC-type transport system permease subunit
MARAERRSLAEVLFRGKSMVPALLLLLAMLVAFFGIATPNFFAWTNFKAVISNIPIIAIMSVGMTFVLLIGGLDISVGSILGFTAVNVVLFHHVGMAPWLVVLCSLGIGLALGSING